MKMYGLGLEEIGARRHLHAQSRCSPLKEGCGLRGPSSLFLIHALKLHVELDELEDEAKL